jgi:hypothetical protein
MSVNHAATQRTADERLVGPDDLAAAVIAARTSADWAPEHRGRISEAGLHRVVQVAYYTSQLPNEGHFPRLSILVPAENSRPRLTTAFEGELTIGTLRRIGPVLDSPQLSLVVEERNGRLQMIGITSLADVLTELSLCDEALPTPSPSNGLYIEIKAPGELRAGEYLRHRLTGGHLYQEKTYILERWFEDWSNTLATDLFGKSQNPRRGAPIGGLWEHLIRKTAALQHGGCFVILDDPSNSENPIRHQFGTTALDLGTAFMQVWSSIRSNRRDVRERMLLRQQLLLAIETASRLSTTDGCVVFNRGLQLYSFGSMIELETQAYSGVPCYQGDSTTPLSQERLRTFGARRRSAIQLCQACPWALAFIISQDGDLRAVVRHGNAVRLYEDLTTW